MQESVTAAWGYLKTSLVRDPVLGRASGLDSPGRAYLLDNYQQPDSGEDAGALRRRRRDETPGSRDARRPGQVIE